MKKIKPRCKRVVEHERIERERHAAKWPKELPAPTATHEERDAFASAAMCKLGFDEEDIAVARADFLTGAPALPIDDALRDFSPRRPPGMVLRGRHPALTVALVAGLLGSGLDRSKP